MKNYTLILKIAVFVLLLTSLVLFVIMPQYTTSYHAGFLDKYERLKALKEPKIILMGDSGVAFGMDSGKIEEAFQMPVVNMGLFNSLGQSFYQETVRPYINAGDIVVLITQENDWNGDGPRGIEDCMNAWTTIENHFYLWENIPRESVWDMVEAFPTYLRNVTQLWITGKGNTPRPDVAYARQAFNQYGDIAYPRPNTTMPTDVGGSVLSEDVSDAMFSYWNGLNEDVSQMGATLLMSCSPLYKPTHIDFDILQKKIEEKLSFPMISQLEQYIYPYEYFFDGVPHLNDQGVSVRTEQLISDLSVWEQGTKGNHTN